MDIGGSVYLRRPVVWSQKVCVPKETLIGTKKTITEGTCDVDTKNLYT